jgi:hypothetical protein
MINNNLVLGLVFLLVNAASFGLGSYLGKKSVVCEVKEPVVEAPVVPEKVEEKK